MQRSMNILRQVSVHSEDRRPELFPLPSRIFRAFLGARGKPRGKIPGSARYEHDNKQESEGGNPPSGHEKSELPCLVLFTPGNNSDTQNPSGEDQKTENPSWNCACN